MVELIYSIKVFILLPVIIVQFTVLGQTAQEYNDRGVNKVALKDYPGAILDYTNAIEIDLNDAIVYYKRGIAKLKLNNKNEVCIDWNKAGELGCQEVYDFIKDECK